MTQTVKSIPSLRSTYIAVIEVKLSGAVMTTQSPFFILSRNKSRIQKRYESLHEIAPGDMGWFHFYYDLRRGQAIEKPNCKTVVYQLSGGRKRLKFTVTPWMMSFYNEE